MIFSHPNLICAFSQRPYNMSLVYGNTEATLKNRKSFLSSLRIDYRDLVCAKQVHGSQIRYVQDKDKGKGALSDTSSLSDTDVLITDKRNLPIGIFTADCLPIFLYDSHSQSIGLIHAGWRSTKENVTKKTIQFMQEKLKTNSENLYVGFGPSIRNCCYEVGKGFKRYFNFGLLQRNQRYFLDLVEINKKQLLDLGVPEKNLSDTKICTSCQNNKFYSYRNEKDNCGRMLSVMMLK